jgi:HlyD family secretion protein
MASAGTIEPAQGDPEVVRVVGQGRRRGRRIFLFGALLLLVAVAAIAVWKLRAPAAPTARFQTQRVERGNLTVSVTATGTLKARDTVDVGAEITGRVLKVYVNFNDPVTEGQVLAEIDTAQAQAKVDQATAQLNSASASLVNARATAAEAKLKLERTKAMLAQGLSPQQDLEAADAAAKRADASVASAAAQVTLSQASLKVEKTNLSKAVIRSPINGIVLNRAVEPGQTVTSGLQTPVLFTLAADLAQLQLNVQVDEADVGSVREGQEATFSVDAYPQQTFASKVLAVKNSPTSGSNVVTYEAWLSVDNTKHLLRPGMTATSTIIVEQRKDVLLVPNVALRFSPFRTTQTSGQQQSGGGFSALLPTNRMRPPGQQKSAGGQGSAPGQGGAGKGRTPGLWIQPNGGEPRRLPVETGPSDGIRTEVRGNEVTEGLEVLVGMIEAPRG